MTAFQLQLPEAWSFFVTFSHFEEYYECFSFLLLFEVRNNWIYITLHWNRAHYEISQTSLQRITKSHCNKCMSNLIYFRFKKKRVQYFTQLATKKPSACTESTRNKQIQISERVPTKSEIPGLLLKNRKAKLNNCTLICYAIFLMKVITRRIIQKKAGDVRREYSQVQKCLKGK